MLDLIFGGTWIDGMENHIKYVELVYAIGRYDDNIRHQEGPKSFREKKKKKDSEMVLILNFTVAS